MPMRKFCFFLFVGAATVAMSAAAVQAQSEISSEDADAVTEGQPNRYSLVEADGDILRVDRQNGTIAICLEQNASWRCNPVPLAEEAYLAEINELAAEVDRLTAELEQFESTEGEKRPKSPGSVLKQPGEGSGGGDQTSKWTEEDEELERMLTFTESAMRRFFGMVRELQRDFEGDGN
ncbi:hypothetical protein [uncultured Roseibium sp.]|uniref:hypothetical protein n=1 Tax=uncultured Roseibium sp. TaxID=1936171 RepID=UPI00260EE1DE|nr:hypothetical protein [uncultured Roseibium sp.]